MNDELSFGRGNINIFSEDVLQEYSDTCAIKAQQLILESNGIDISEHELRDEAMQNGWYAPGYGTPMEDTGNLLDAHGLEVHRQQNATMADIANELSEGHQVIVGVDSGELWNAGPDETFEDFIHGEKADHALIVSGFVLDPLTAEKNVLLTDPGTGDVCMEYPVEQFEDAWNDSGDFMVSVI